MTHTRRPDSGRTSEFLEGPPVGYDPERIKAAVREFLIGIGEDPDRDGLLETPERVARACAELFSGLGKDSLHLLSKTFDVSHDEIT